MTDHNRIVTVCRVLLVVMAVVVAIIALQGKDRGLRIDTSLSDMVPVAAKGAAKVLAVKQAQQLAEQGIVLMLEAVDADKLDAADGYISTALAGLSHLVQRSDAEAFEEDFLKGIADSLAPHRFHLLSPQHRSILENHQTEEVLELALAELYSPGGNFRLLPVQKIRLIS